jgi:hypothetical protein
MGEKGKFVDTKRETEKEKMKLFIDKSPYS